MANNITGKVVNEIQFKINKKSWDNLTQFQNKITNIKRQLSSLKGSIKVQAVVSQVNQVTRAVTQGANRIKKAQLDLPHLFPSGKTNSASKTAFADMLRSEKKQADQRERLIQKQALSEERVAERLNRKLQGLDDKRVKDRNRIEQRIAFKEQGASLAFNRREIGASPEHQKHLKSGRESAFNSIANANRELRQGSISLQEYNMKVNHAVQSNMRMARSNTNNAFSLRDMRSELVQLTAAYTAFSAGVNIFQTGKEFDSLQAGMRLFAKDDAGVKDTMSFLRSESERLGTNFEQAATSFTKFAIVARNKMSQSQTRELFTGLSEYATVMQVDQHRFQRSMMAIQQMMSKGKISSEELRLQLAENLPGSVEIFATAMGMSEATMFKQMEQGKILAEDVLPKVAKEYSRIARQNGALEAAQQKVNSQFQRFLNSLTDAKIQIFEGGFGEGLADLFKTMASGIRGSLPFLRTFGSVMKGVFAVVSAAIQVVLTPFEVFSKLLKDLEIGKLGAIIGATGTLALIATRFHVITKAVQGLNASLLLTLKRFGMLVAIPLVLEDMVGAYLGKESLISETGKSITPDFIRDYKGAIEKNLSNTSVQYQGKLDFMMGLFKKGIGIDVNVNTQGVENLVTTTVSKREEETRANILANEGG